MARSNQGGTRGFIRGKVANDLYQVTRTATGRKVQLVRAVEESRINNNTVEQALARMRMALLMGALSDLKEIVDHSWQGIPYGQLSIANFVKINMPLVIEDCKEHWVSENQYCYPVKGVKAMRVGAFILSSGSLQTPTNIRRGHEYNAGQFFPFDIMVGKEDFTFGDLRQSLGLNADDYITLLMATGLNMGSSGIVNQGFQFIRLYLSGNIPDSTIVTDDNVLQVFYTEGNTTFTAEVDAVEGFIRYYVNCSPDGISRECLAQSVIVSRWDGKVWCRNSARFEAFSGQTGLNFEYNSPWTVFQSWYPAFDPKADDSQTYPGKL